MANPHHARPEHYSELTVRALLTRPEKRPRAAVSPARTPEADSRRPKKQKSRTGPPSVASKGSYAGRRPPPAATPVASTSRTRLVVEERASPEYQPEGTPASDSDKQARRSATRNRSKTGKAPVTRAIAKTSKAPEDPAVLTAVAPDVEAAGSEEPIPPKAPRRTQQKIHDQLQSNWAARVAALPATFRGEGPAPPFGARQIKALRIAEGIVVSLCSSRVR